jgi:nucleotide-binding universal stress UspA family protein
MGCFQPRSGVRSIREENDAMALRIQKVLVPVVFANTTRHVVHQAAWLARRFQAEILLLHVVEPFSDPGGELESGHQISVRDLHAHLTESFQKDLENALRPELGGISVTRLLLKGEPEEEIVRTARDQNVDLIMMSTRGRGPFYRLLLGSVTAKVLHECDCPVWTGVHLEEPPVREFSIRHVLCSVDLGPHSLHTVSGAAALAAAVDATLTLVHVTAGVETFGPGGTHIDPAWQKAIVGYAAKRVAEIQEAAGTKVNVLIQSGQVTEQLNQAVRQTNADVLVIGHAVGRSHLGDNGNGYGIIRTSRIPVLSL